MRIFPHESPNSIFSDQEYVFPKGISTHRNLNDFFLSVKMCSYLHSIGRCLLDVLSPQLSIYSLSRQWQKCKCWSLNKWLAWRSEAFCLICRNNLFLLPCFTSSYTKLNSLWIPSRSHAQMDTRILYFCWVFSLCKERIIMSLCNIVCLVVCLSVRGTSPPPRIGCAERVHQGEHFWK